MDETLTKKFLDGKGLETLWYLIGEHYIGKKEYANDNNYGIIKIGSCLSSNDNGIISVSTDDKTITGVSKLQLGQNIIWVNTDSNSSNINNFVNYGVYNLFGEHTRNIDNLPIYNTGGGHTFNGRLFVYDSSLPDTGNANDDCCITQVLTLSNRVGKDGNIYIRTGSGPDRNNISWGNWGKMQTNIETGLICEGELTKYIDNGIYSGTVFNGSGAPVIKYDNAYFQFNGIVNVLNTTFNMYTYIHGNEIYNSKTIYSISINDQTSGVIASSHTNNEFINPVNFENAEYFNYNLFNLPYSQYYITFVLITVNNYLIAESNGLKPMCSQLLYGINIDGTFILKKRTGTRNNDTGLFNNWEDINKNIEIPVATTDVVGGIKVTSVAPENITLQDTTTTTNRNYGLQIDSNGKGFVNIPWTDTTSLKTTNYVGTSFNGVLTPYSICELINSSISSVKITGFNNPTTSGITTEYGILFTAKSNTIFSWPTNVTVKWANGVAPCENNATIGVGTWLILFTYMPGSKVYLATFAKYN